MHYLRGADAASYEREMGRLWREPVRKHLRHLLIDFLGQASPPPPSLAEQVWLLEYLSIPEFRTKVLAAIRGNDVWFGILAAVQLPAIMRLPVDDAWPMVGILGAAFSEHRRRCLALLREEWLFDPSKDRLTWGTLEQLADWDNEALDLATRVLKRSDIPATTIMSLASRIAEDAPEAAITLIRTRLTQELERLEAAPDPTPPPLPPDATDSDRIVQGLTFDPRERFKRLLDTAKTGTGFRNSLKRRQDASSDICGRGSYGSSLTSS